ncbi:hypothetical protein QTP88_014630 [Uroleucon formosanum]
MDSLVNKTTKNSSENTTENNKTSESTSNINKTSENTSIINKKNNQPIFQTHKKNQITLPSYPNVGGRSFRSQWFKLFDWLEYCPEKNVAFCYLCRIVGNNETKEIAIYVTRYSNWKKALENNKGFYKHQSSSSHRICITKLVDKQKRVETTTEISTLLNENVLKKHRYYVKLIFEIIIFLVVNELPIHGDFDLEMHKDTCLFQSLFRYTLKKDTKLAGCAKLIPQNATYLSPVIQNETINIMHNAVQNSVVEDLKNADVHAIRYVKNGKPIESLLSIKNSTNLNPAYFVQMTLDLLKSLNINTDYMLSQCYDDASVMSGTKGGVQALMQKRLDRIIPYVHCYNHQLHLVIVKVVSEVTEIGHFFDQCRLIHKVFNTFKINSLYEGNNTVRLLEQRLSSHLKICEIIYNNYDNMINCLKKVHGKSFDGNEVAQCAEFPLTMKKKTFRFALCLMLKCLRYIKPADNILQSRETGLTLAIPIIHSVINSLKQSRNEEMFDAILKDCEHLLPEAETESPKCKRKTTIKLNEYILSESSSTYTNYVNDDINISLLSTFYEVIDKIKSEMETPFEKNDELIKAVSNIYELNYDDFKIFNDLKINIPSKEEIICVKNYLKENNISNKNILLELYQ